MRIPPALVAGPLYVLYNIWCRTLRYTVEGRDGVNALWHKGQPLVFALWHDELFPLMHVREDLRIVTVVSQSKDGEYLAGLLQRLGLVTARGSSSRGGVKALLQTAKLMRQDNRCGCITVDGPRGPRHVAKEGAVFLAARTPAPIVPIRLYMENTWCFHKAWDKFLLPKPFSRIRVIFGQPYTVGENALTPEGLERERAILEARLEELK